MEKKRPIISRRKVLVIGMWAVLLILLGTDISGVSAKYVKKVDNQAAVVRAREFYFTSDLLEEGGRKYPLNPGTKSVSFELRNYGDDLRFSEGDVTFEVECAGAAITVEPAGNFLEGAKKSAAKVTLSGLADGQTYRVYATGSCGYQKQLSAEFEVLAQGTSVYKYLEMDASGTFVLLTVWTESVGGAVSIEFPAGLIPDGTDSALSEIKNYVDGRYCGNNTPERDISKSAGSLGAYSSHTYRFFLETPFASCEAGHFTVTVGGVPAGEKTPK